MANPQQNPNDRTSGNQTQGNKDNPQTRQQQGGDRSQTQTDDWTNDPNRKGKRPGDSDNEAARGADKSTNGEEFDREGRNPKPFSVG